jgi:hypothetical protein
MSIAVVAVTTEQSGDLSLTGVGTALRASTRVHDDDGASSFGTERDAAQSISVEDSSAIIEGGLRTVVTVSAESREVGDAQQGRIWTPLVWGRGFHCGQPGRSGQLIQY